MDPLRRARSGRLYLLQHGVYDILADAKRANRYLVTFIDDLDRCGPRTTAEVFEAINLFLSGEFSGARFVLAVDPSVVAAQLNTIFADSNRANVAITPDDPDVGWSFLRKFVQLPVILPVTRSKQRMDPLEGLLGSTESVEVSYNSKTDDIAGGADLSVSSTDKQEEPIQTDVFESTQDSRSADEIQRNVRMARIEHNEVFRHLLRERLDARPGCSMREIKRLLTVWQFYVRQMDRDAPARSADMVERACHLLILAEIVTRWPAIQGRIHRPIEGTRGLEVLAKASSDDHEWGRAIGKLGLTGKGDMGICTALRQLLKDYDGLAVANLAGNLF